MRFTGKILLATLALTMTLASAARACVAFVETPQGPLEVSKVAVKLAVDDLVANFTVTQTFQNPHDVDVEGRYVFPVPKGASVASFALLVDGKRIEAKVTEKAAAKKAFQQLVKQSRDPALLEYLGGEVFEARVGRVPARGERQVELVYQQTLTPTQGLFEVRLPLEAGRTRYGNLRELTFEGELKTSFKLQNVYCPTHPLAVDRQADGRASFDFAARNVDLSKDLQLFFSASEKDLGVNLMTHRAPGQDGYFLLLLSPPTGKGYGKVARDVSLVVDTSGSMRGAKIKEARKALDFVLDRLGPEDRFELVSFSSGVKNLTKGLVANSSRERARAAKLIEGLRATGGTNIHGALLESLKSRSGKRPHVVVFLTDGEPTEGITDASRIREAVRGRNQGQSRVFVVGVGFNLDVKLMDGLSSENKGASVYVKPGERLDQQMDKWFAKISHPVLTDLELDLGAVETEFTYPEELPDLYAGDQVMLVGRYSGDGPSLLRLRGRSQAGRREYLYDVEFPKQDLERDFLRRIWAQRRIGYLLDKIRLLGEKPELKDEVVRLAEEFNIVTPYTSLLVEDGRSEAEPAPRPKRPTMPRPSPPPPKDQGWFGRLSNAASGMFGGGKVNRLLGTVSSTLDSVDMEEDAAGAPADFASRRKAAPAPVRVRAAKARARVGFGRSASGGGGYASGAAAPGEGAAFSAAPSAAPSARRGAVGNIVKKMDLNARSGRQAVEAAEQLAKMKEAEVVAAAADANQRYVAGKSFRLEAGVWVDAEVEQLPASARSLKIEWGSDAYFALLAVKPELARWLSLGEAVHLEVDGVRVEVGADGEASMDELQLRAFFTGGSTSR